MCEVVSLFPNNVLLDRLPNTHFSFRGVMRLPILISEFQAPRHSAKLSTISGKCQYRFLPGAHMYQTKYM